MISPTATNTPHIPERSSYLRRADTYSVLLPRCDWYREPSLNPYTEHVFGNLPSSLAVRPDPSSSQDQIAYQTRPDSSNPLFTPMMGCLIAGSRSTRKNGATAVIPGSHLWPHDRAPAVSECTYAEMEPGSALFTLGSTYHGAGENPVRADGPGCAQDLVRRLWTEGLFQAGSRGDPVDAH